MDFYSFAPIAALLQLASQAVTGLASLFAPVSGDLAMTLAIVTLTILVRTALIPVGVSQVRAEFTRRRLAPQLQAISARHKNNPEKLQRATLDLYAGEKVSPFAGMLPTLAQAPVISIVYGLFILATINEQPNALLHETFFGVSLGQSFFSMLGSGSVWPDAAVYVAIFAAIGLTAWGSRRAMIAQQRLNGGPVAPAMARVTGILSWMPFATIVVAAFVPLAAAVYLVVTASWTLSERAIIRRRFTARGSAA